MAVSRGKGEEQDIARLTSWFTENGGSIDGKITLARDATGGIAVYAKEDMPNPPDGGYKICVCPPNLHLSHLQAPSELFDLLPEHVLAFIALVKELLLGEESFWAPYIRCLPESSQMTTPIFFHEEKTQEAINERRNDTAWLLGTNLDKAWRARAQQWEEDWENATKVMQQQGLSTEGYTWDLYKWAATIYSSRSFISDPGADNKNDIHPILIPFVDMLNHRFPAKVNWFYDHGAFALSVADPIVRGQEIFNNYGGKGNEELLNGYGFCIPSNPCDTVSLRFGALPAAITAAVQAVLPTWSPTQVNYMRSHAHYQGLYTITIPNSPTSTPKTIQSGIPQPIWTVLHALQASKDNTGPTPRHPSRTLLTTALNILELLATKHDTIDQYNDFLPPRPQNPAQAHARLYRTSQLSILHSNIQDLESLVLGPHLATLSDAAAALADARSKLPHATWTALVQEARDLGVDVNVGVDVDVGIGDGISVRIRDSIDITNTENPGNKTQQHNAWLAVLTTAALLHQQQPPPPHDPAPRILAWIADLAISHPPPARAGLRAWALRVLGHEARMLAYVDGNEKENRWSGEVVLMVGVPGWCR